MFTESTITWVPSGFFGYIWLNTKIVLKNILTRNRWSLQNDSDFINAISWKKPCRSTPLTCVAWQGIVSLENGFAWCPKGQVCLWPGKCSHSEKTFDRIFFAILVDIHNQIYHANGAPVTLIAQHGFKFKCSAGRTTTFHDIELNDKHITGLIDPILLSGAVTKQYSDSKLALAVNELINKIYLNTASLSNLQTDMISCIEAQSTTAVSVNSNQDEKIQEMLGKIELNVSGLVSLRRETIELLNKTRTAIETDHEQKMSTVRSRQQIILLPLRGVSIFYVRDIVNRKLLLMLIK